jgi:hypothetical protein
MTIWRKILQDLESILTFCESVTDTFCEKIRRMEYNYKVQYKRQAQQLLSIFC